MTSTLLLMGVLSVASQAYAAQAPVGLGTAGTYSVLGGQTVTNTGPSTLSGDLGVSPGTAITGFPPGTVGGATHAADAQAAQAQSDLVSAYDDAAGRAPTASVAGDLVGQTLISGVYKSTGPLALSGTLTLDAQGDPNAVFIFQIASTLITASASNVNVINAAQACHVYWQVGASATLGTTSSFKGTIMALTSITVATGTTVQGRALARNGQVSLDNNTFTTPGCATPTPTPTPTTAAPTATGATSAQGQTSADTVVTVTGSGFQPGQTTVTLGGTTIPASAVTVISPTKLTSRMPPRAGGPVSVAVTTPSGRSRPLGFTHVAGIRAPRPATHRAPRPATHPATHRATHPATHRATPAVTLPVTGSSPGALVTLPVTGSSTGPLVTLGALLLTAGCAVLLFSRRLVVARHRR